MKKLSFLILLLASGPCLASGLTLSGSVMPTLAPSDDMTGTMFTTGAAAAISSWAVDSGTNYIESIDVVFLGLSGTGTGRASIRADAATTLALGKSYTATASSPRITIPALWLTSATLQVYASDPSILVGVGINLKK